MRDTNLVNALREHADWWGNGDMMEPLGGLEKDLAEAADLIEAQAKEIEKLRAQLPHWIPVKERLPKYGVKVLATDMYEEDDCTGIWTREEYKDDADGCWYDEHGWWHALDEVTHWMPLPKTPEVEPDE